MWPPTFLALASIVSARSQDIEKRQQNVRQLNAMLTAMYLVGALAAVTMTCFFIVLLFKRLKQRERKLRFSTFNFD